MSYGIRKTTNKHVNLNKTKIKPDVNAHPQTNKKNEKIKRIGDKANLNKRNRNNQLAMKDQGNIYHPLFAQKGTDYKSKLQQKYNKWHEEKIIKGTLSIENKISKVKLNNLEVSNI